MNKKKYIGVGIFAAVIVVGAGVAYYCYPAEINSMIGIGVPQAGVIADGVSSSALALDDGAAAHFVGTRLKEVVSSRPNARAMRVALSKGSVVEKALPVRYL